MATITAEVRNGEMRVACGKHAVSIRPPHDIEATAAALDVLLEKLAGVSKFQLIMAVHRAREKA